MSHLNTTTSRAVLLATLLSTVALSSASDVYAQTQRTQTARIDYATPLSSLTHKDETAEYTSLNWRNSELVFTFDLSTANLTDNIELLISATPQGGVNPRAPLTVQFNSEEPVPLKVNGQGFDARLILAPNKARSANNIVRISYNPENGAECIAPKDGAWDIDMRASKLVVNSRAKRRGLHFHDVGQYLSNPSLAPRRVGLIATSKNATQLQALAAQAIGLHMDELPDFTTDRQSSDLEIIMARRSELYQYISDDSYVAGNGAGIFIPRERPAKLVFTGDTDADILAAVKNFAELSLPTPRRAETSLGEMRLQSSLKSGLVRLSGTHAISSLPSASSFSNWSGDDWASGSKSLRFDVTDPNAMTGEVLLRLASSKNVSDTSKLSVELNGKSLGTTVLDKRRKSVAFEIKAGALRGKDNVLTLMPEINSNAAPSCSGPQGPNFHLGGGSKISLTAQTPSPPTELSRMTATAAPFSDAQGAQSYIAMTGSTADFNASLKVLARLAKTAGEGLIAADYSRRVNLAQAEGKHVLYIGPSNRLPRALIGDAPRAFTDALRGQVFEGDNLISANVQKFASLNSDASFKLAARRLSQSRRIREGGVAALYPAQNSDAHITGIITNTPGQSYRVSAETISQAPYWSEIKGGVARWNEGAVLTVQAPQLVPGYSAPDTSQNFKSSGFIFNTSIFDGAINKAGDLTQQGWTGVKDLAASLNDKLLSSLGGKAKTPDAVKVKLPKSDDITPQARPDSAQTTKGKLHAANSWARNMGENIRTNAANFKLSESVSNAQKRLRLMGQGVGNLLKPNTTPYENQSFVQKLLNPAPLLGIIAVLLMLLGLMSAKPSSRGGRG